MQKLCQHVLGGGQGGNEAEALAAVVPGTPLRAAFGRSPHKAPDTGSGLSCCP